MNSAHSCLRATPNNRLFPPHTHAGNRMCHISECFIMMQFACQVSIPAAAAADYGSAPGCVLFMIHLLPFKIHQYTLMEVKLETPGKAGAWEMNFTLLLFRTAMFRKAMQRGQCAVRRLERPPVCVSACKLMLRNNILLDFQCFSSLNYFPLLLLATMLDPQISVAFQV